MNSLIAFDINFSFNLLVPFVLSLICGAIIGAERTKSGRSAGIRTYALVCLGCCAVMTITNHPSLLNAQIGAGQFLRVVDPTRIIQGVLSGIGFLGAGLIFKNGLHVRGLTTAASVWAVSVVGILIGMSFFLAGVLATALIVAVLSMSRYLETKVAKTRYVKLSVAIDKSKVNKAFLTSLFNDAKFQVSDVFYKKTKNESGFEYLFILKTDKPDTEESLVNRLDEVPGIIKFTLSPGEDF